MIWLTREGKKVMKPLRLYVLEFVTKAGESFSRREWRRAAYRSQSEAVRAQYDYAEAGIDTRIRLLEEKNEGESHA